jgi:hypothetical protein
VGSWRDVERVKGWRKGDRGEEEKFKVEGLTVRGRCGGLSLALESPLQLRAGKGSQTTELPSDIPGFPTPWETITGVLSGWEAQLASEERTMLMVNAPWPTLRLLGHVLLLPLLRGHRAAEDPSRPALPTSHTPLTISRTERHTPAGFVVWFLPAMTSPHQSSIVPRLSRGSFLFILITAIFMAQYRLTQRKLWIGNRPS